MEGYYPSVPKTMEELIKELFNPPTKKPFFKGYTPQNRFLTKPTPSHLAKAVLSLSAPSFYFQRG